MAAIEQLFNFGTLAVAVGLAFATVFGVVQCIAGVIVTLLGSDKA
jgi:hypothetical protein